MVDCTYCRMDKVSSKWNVIFSSLFSYIVSLFCPSPLCLPPLTSLSVTPHLYIDFCIADVPEPCGSGGSAEESQPKTARHTQSPREQEHVPPTEGQSQSYSLYGTVAVHMWSVQEDRGITLQQGWGAPPHPSEQSQKHCSHNLRVGGLLLSW